ncbi:MAG: hypothetical protein JKX93_05245 [Rhizobiaceae bacterium]|nr:hypothetical protein [Rhizobiaceae bacterium]
MAARAIKNWAGRDIRLDPFHLPQNVRSDADYSFSYSIDRDGAKLKRTLGCGLPVSINLPAKSFTGIAARAIETADGGMFVSLELYHDDADLCLPVLVTDNMDDIAADWHAWSRMLSLPMLILDSDNLASPVRKLLGELMVEDPIERRKRFRTVRHRPNFLRRRKMGVVGKVVRIDAAEIIARR